MMPQRWWLALGCLAVTCMCLSAVGAQTLPAPTPSGPQAPRPPQSAPPTPPGQDQQQQQIAPPAAPAPDASPPSTNNFSQGAEAGSSLATTAAPNMFGDFLGVYTSISGHRIPVNVPGPFKVADNGSPIPQDNFGVFYQYFSNVLGGGTPTDRSVGRTTVHREVADIEQSFFCKWTSVEARVPFIQTNANGDGYETIGDLNLIFKQALYKSECDEAVVSAGLSVVVPVGNSIFYGTPSGGQEKFHATLVQPFVGYYFDCPHSGYFLQGFFSAELASDPRFPSFAFADVALDKWLYYTHCCKACISGIALEFEFHSNSALTNAGQRRLNNNDAATVAALEQIALTTGIDFIFYRHANIGVAVTVPVTGPVPYDYEMMTRINFKF